MTTRRSFLKKMTASSLVLPLISDISSLKTFPADTPQLRVAFCGLSPAYGYGPLKGRSSKGSVEQPIVTHQTYQMDGIANCILNNAPHPNCDGYEGLKDMKIIEAIYKSIAKNGKRIAIKI